MLFAKNNNKSKRFESHPMYQLMANYCIRMCISNTKLMPHNFSAVHVSHDKFDEDIMQKGLMY